MLGGEGKRGGGNVCLILTLLLLLQKQRILGMTVFHEEKRIQRGWAPQCALTFPDGIPPIRSSIWTQYTPLGYT
jgi:hypothetical protein